MAQFETMQFTFDKKNNKTNDSNTMSKWSLNPIKDDAVETVGKKPYMGVQSSHAELLRRNMIKRNPSELYVNGYCHREVNTIIHVETLGNKFDKK